MSIISFSQKDLLRGKIVTPGWYRIHIENQGEKLAKDSQSTNYLMEATIVNNDDDGSAEFVGVPLEWNFNSKAMGFIIGYLKAMGHDVELDKRYDLGKTIGHDVVAFVGNKLYEGRILNNVTNQYRALRTE